jgi:hypothetical protein
MSIAPAGTVSAGLECLSVAPTILAQVSCAGPRPRCAPPLIRAASLSLAYAAPALAPGRARLTIATPSQGFLQLTCRFTPEDFYALPADRCGIERRSCTASPYQENQYAYGKRVTRDVSAHRGASTKTLMPAAGDPNGATLVSSYPCETRQTWSLDLGAFVIALTSGCGAFLGSTHLSSPERRANPGPSCEGSGGQRWYLEMEEFLDKLSGGEASLGRSEARVNTLPCTSMLE